MKEKAYLLGVGGAGVSAVAKYLYKQGYVIAGSDPTHSELIQDLQDNYQLQYNQGHKAENIKPDVSVVIYSPAIEHDNPELVKAQSLNIPIYSYPEYLGVISQDKKTIAIAGTNGKSTTTTMVGELLVNQGFDPTVIVGATMRAFNSNYVYGDSNYFVVEACEYKESFLSLSPDILVITNITPDHLDYFKTPENYKQVFMRLVSQMNSGSTLVCNADDPELITIISRAHELGIEVINYKDEPKVNLPLPGEYNMENAQAALGVVRAVSGIPGQAQEYLEQELQGSGRRFERLGTTVEGHVVYDDYAHNPEGIDALVQGLRSSFPESQIVMFFQPHLFSRTRDFFQEFCQALTRPDQLFLLPIYHAREEEGDFEMSSVILSQGIMLYEPSTEPIVCGSFEDAVEKFNSYEYPKKTVVITVGAGDIRKVGEMLTREKDV